MKRSGPPARKTPMRRTPMRRTSRPAAGRWSRASKWEHDLLVEALRRRSKGVCELCRDAPSSEGHHRRMRSAGGLDLIENLLDLCWSCHHVTIHGNPDWAYRHGLLLSRHSATHPEPVRGCPLDCDVDHL